MDDAPMAPVELEQGKEQRKEVHVALLAVVVVVIHFPQDLPAIPVVQYVVVVVLVQHEIAATPPLDGLPDVVRETEMMLNVLLDVVVQLEVQTTAMVTLFVHVANLEMAATVENLPVVEEGLAHQVMATTATAPLVSAADCWAMVAVPEVDGRVVRFVVVPLVALMGPLVVVLELIRFEVVPLVALMGLLVVVRLVVVPLVAVCSLMVPLVAVLEVDVVQFVVVPLMAVLGVIVGVGVDVDVVSRWVVAHVVTIVVVVLEMAAVQVGVKAEDVLALVAAVTVDLVAQLAAVGRV